MTLRLAVLSIFVFGIMFTLKAQSTNPAGCVLEGSLYSDSSELIIGLPFVLFVRDNGVTGCQLHVQYPTQTGNPSPVRPNVIIRLLDTYSSIVSQGASGLVEFTQNGVDFALNRDWVEAVYEHTSGGAMIILRDARTRFVTDESFAIIRSRFVVCPPVGGQDTFLLDAENGLYVANDTIVRMGGFLIEPTQVQTNGFNFSIKDTATSQEIAISNGNISGHFTDTIAFFGRRVGSYRQMILQGEKTNEIYIRDTSLFGDLVSLYQGFYGDGKLFMYMDANGLGFDEPFSRIQLDIDSAHIFNRRYLPSTDAYKRYFTAKSGYAELGAIEGEPGILGTGVKMGAYGYGVGSGADEWLFMKTKAVDNRTARRFQYLQLQDSTNGRVEFATIDLSGYITGIGTTNRIARFTSATEIGDANIDNDANRIAFSLPFLPATWTTITRPTGVRGYFGYGDTGLEWHNGTRWAQVPEFTFNRGGTGRIPYPNSDGQYTESPNFYRGTSGTLFNIMSGSGELYAFEGSGDPGSGIGNSVNLRFTNSNATNNKTQFWFGGAGSSFRQWNFGTDPHGVGDNTMFIYSIGGGSMPVYLTSNGNVRLGRNSLSTAGMINNYSLIVDRTDAMLPPKGTTAQRPSTLEPGIFRYDVTRGAFSGYDTRWFDFVEFSDNQMIVQDNGGTGLGSAIGGYFLNTNATSRKSEVTLGSASNSSQRWVLGTDINGAGNDNFYIYTPYGGQTVLYATGSNGFVRIGHGGLPSAGLANSYQLQIDGSNAIGLPRGSVVQRPTIVNNTTPLRFNTDSTALEYGESAGGWRQLATRAYARSLVSGLAADTHLGNTNLTVTGNRIITTNNYDIDFDNITGFNLISGGRQGNTSMVSDVYWSIKQFQDLAKNKYFRKIHTMDSRENTVVENPNFVDIFEWNIPSGTNYEWGNATILDTTNATFTYKFGGRYYNSFLFFNALRPTTGIFNRLLPTYDFNVAQVGNASAWSPHTTFRNGSDTLVQIKHDGVLEAKSSKILAEVYNTITSTSSPQTFSSTISDNFVNQGGTQASFTFLFPASPVDGQVLTMTWNNAISTLTLDGNGNSIIGSAVVTAVAGSQRKFKFYSGVGWVKIY